MNMPFNVDYFKKKKFGITSDIYNNPSILSPEEESRLDYEALFHALRDAEGVDEAAQSAANTVEVMLIIKVRLNPTHVIAVYGDHFIRREFGKLRSEGPLGRLKFLQFLALNHSVITNILDL